MDISTGTPAALQHGPGPRAGDLRAGGAARALDRIRAALAGPDGDVAHLAAVFNDAGARDAAVAMTAAAGGPTGDRWERLAAAARAAGRYALADGGPSTHGPLAVLALTRWAAGDRQGAARMCEAVPVQDAAHRFAALIAMTSQSSDFARFAAAAGRFDLAATLAFHRTPTPAAPPAAGAAAWFADPRPAADAGPAGAREELLRRQGLDMAARGWSMHVTDQTDLGGGIAWTGVLRRDGGAVAMVTQDGRGGAPLVRFADRSADRRWRDDLAAAGIGEETAITGLDIIDAILPDPPQQDGRAGGAPPTAGRQDAAAPPQQEDLRARLEVLEAALDAALQELASERAAAAVLRERPARTGAGQAPRSSTAPPAAAAPPRPRTVRGPVR